MSDLDETFTEGSDGCALPFDTISSLSVSISFVFVWEEVTSTNSLIVETNCYIS